jgi:hypothetical protein
VASLDDKIDDLYKQPLADFTGSRNALAKSLKGDEAKRVKALAKPTLVPWAVNQVYWRARSAYDRLLMAGDRLRKAQIAALEGKPADVRAFADAHRRAIADAVGEAERLARAAGSTPAPDALTRTFEALSLAPEPPETAGRFTEALAPAGFEALAGITPVSSKSQVPSRKSEVASHKSEVASHKSRVEGRESEVARPTAAERRAAEKEAKERAEREAEARKHQAELRKADAAVTRAEANEKLARATWERAHDALLEARRKRDELKKSQVSSLKSRV